MSAKNLVYCRVVHICAKDIFCNIQTKFEEVPLAKSRLVNPYLAFLDSQHANNFYSLPTKERIKIKKQVRIISLSPDEKRTHVFL